LLISILTTYGADMIQYLAVVEAWVGEKDAAFAHLAKAAQLPGFLCYGRLKLTPWWDPLRLTATLIVFQQGHFIHHIVCAYSDVVDADSLVRV
jgi:hypothetical protein